jgi:hypothetical protein
VPLLCVFVNAFALSLTVFAVFFVLLSCGLLIIVFLVVVISTFSPLFAIAFAPDFLCISGTSTTPDSIEKKFGKKRTIL